MLFVSLKATYFRNLKNKYICCFDEMNDYDVFVDDFINIAI